MIRLRVIASRVKNALCHDVSRYKYTAANAHAKPQVTRKWDSRIEKRIHHQPDWNRYDSDESKFRYWELLYSILRYSEMACVFYWEMKQCIKFYCISKQSHRSFFTKIFKPSCNNKIWSFNVQNSVKNIKNYELVYYHFTKCIIIKFRRDMIISKYIFCNNLEN